MEFKLNCINIRNKVSALGRFVFCFLYVQTLVYKFYLALYIYYILCSKLNQGNCKVKFQDTLL